MFSLSTSPCLHLCFILLPLVWPNPSFFINLEILLLLLVVRMPIHSCPWLAINCSPLATSPTQRHPTDQVTYLHRRHQQHQPTRLIQVPPSPQACWAVRHLLLQIWWKVVIYILCCKNLDLYIYACCLVCRRQSRRSRLLPSPFLGRTTRTSTIPGSTSFNSPAFPLLVLGWFLGLIRNRCCFLLMDAIVLNFVSPKFWSKDCERFLSTACYPKHDDGSLLT